MPEPEPTALVAALPLTVPFVAPEELARRAGRADLLRLGANESAFGPPPAALAAMRDALPHTSWYGDPESAELRDALAERHGCTPANLTVASGIDDVLGLAVRAFLAPGDTAVAAFGTYPTFAFHVAGYGAQLATIPYERDGTLDLDALARLAHERRAKLAYLANPDNPSGSFVSRAAAARLRAALPHDTLLVLDEAYADFVPPDEAHPATVEPGVLRARTFSKAYGLAGARIGYALAAAETVAHFQKIRLHYGVNRTAQVGALAALREQAFVAGVASETARGRAEYRALGVRHGLATLGSYTNFTLFDLGTKARADALLAELLRLGVFVRKPGAPPLDRCIRVTVGAPDERARFAEHLGEALEALDAKAASA